MQAFMYLSAYRTSLSLLYGSDSARTNLVVGFFYVVARGPSQVLEGFH